MTIMTKPTGFCWYELMTTDMEAAERFYRAVVGWQARDAGQPGMRYRLFTVGDVPAAGLMAVPDEAAAAGARPAWVGYVAVENADEAAARLTEAGGKLHRPSQDIPGIGRFAVVADPQGAMFMLFQPGAGEPPPPFARGTPGSTGWHELLAADWESAFAFYAGQFGWTKATAFDMGPMGTYQLFAAGGEPIGGMMNKPAEVPVPAWLYYFNVADIDAAAARTASEGGKVLMGPMEVPGGSWIIQGMDPQGAMFALVGPRA
jgi:predicted enzyme related to lactoylglutathione lyase